MERTPSKEGDFASSLSDSSHPSASSRSASVSESTSFSVSGFDDDPERPLLRAPVVRSQPPGSGKASIVSWKALAEAESQQYSGPRTANSRASLRPPARDRAVSVSSNTSSILAEDGHWNRHQRSDTGWSDATQTTQPSLRRRPAPAGSLRQAALNAIGRPRSVSQSSAYPRGPALSRQSSTESIPSRSNNMHIRVPSVPSSGFAPMLNHHVPALSFGYEKAFDHAIGFNGGFTLARKRSRIHEDVQRKLEELSLTVSVPSWRAPEARSDRLSAHRSNHPSFRPRSPRRTLRWCRHRNPASVLLTKHEG